MEEPDNGVRKHHLIADRQLPLVLRPHSPHSVVRTLGDGVLLGDVSALALHDQLELVRLEQRIVPQLE